MKQLQTYINPVVAGVELTTDSEGRFNLNALHKASGYGEEKAPSKWMRNSSTQELVQELTDGQICTSPVSSIKGGLHQGTYAHELLAVSYAGWISPKFHLKVNQVFLDYKSGKLQPQFQLPQNYEEALESLLGQVKENRMLQAVVVEKDEKIDELGKLISDYEKQLAAGVTPPNFAKQLWGVHSNLVNSHLEKRGWLRKDARGNWRVNSMARDHYLTERIYDKDNGYGGYYTVYAHFLTKAGAVSIFKDYVNKKLPMRKGWDGTIGGGNVINLVNED